MIGLGTLINVAAIILGGLLGKLIGDRLKERYQKIVNTGLALSIIFLSIGGVLSEMLVLDGDVMISRGAIMSMIAMVLGALLGEYINIDYHVERLGYWLKSKSPNEEDSEFVNSFVAASLTVCVGAMAVMGALMDGPTGEYSILITKAVMDVIIIFIMSASKGIAPIFSALPVLLLQGTVTLSARFIAPLMNDLAISNLSFVGSILIFAIGVNMLMEDRFRIKVANLLPSIIFAVIAAYIPWLR